MTVTDPVVLSNSPKLVKSGEKKKQLNMNNGNVLTNVKSTTLEPQV